MKRKINHDAINNQEDEDSSAYPIYFTNEVVSNRRKKSLPREKVTFFRSKDLEDKIDLGLKVRYP